MRTFRTLRKQLLYGTYIMTSSQSGLLLLSSKSCNWYFSQLVGLGFHQIAWQNCVSCKNKLALLCTCCFYLFIWKFSSFLWSILLSILGLFIQVHDSVLVCVFRNYSCWVNLGVWFRDLKHYVWQSRVEIKHYSVAYFDHFAEFEVLKCRTSVKGGAQTCMCRCTNTWMFTHNMYEFRP